MFGWVFLFLLLEHMFFMWDLCVCERILSLWGSSWSVADNLGPVGTDPVQRCVHACAGADIWLHSVVRQTTQTAIDAASLQSQSWAHLKRRKLYPVPTKTQFISRVRLQTSGCGSSTSPQWGFCFSQPHLCLLQLVCFIHLSQNRGWGDGASQQGI